MAYPEAINLPFNFRWIRDSFLPAKPGDQDAREPGYRAIVRGEQMVFCSSKGPLRLVEDDPAGPPPAGALLLGQWKGRPLRLVRLASDASLPPGCASEPLLFLFFRGALDDEMCTLAGLAQQVAVWEQSSAACPRCGTATRPIAGTWGKKCPKCGYEHFPSVSPCVLALVTRGDRVLLVRKRDWPKGHYSLPSGFCDLGECLEECLIREVAEETGVRVKATRYLGSQSWPFPSQLMVGFAAEADSSEIVVEQGELEDAAWYKRGALPPTFSDKSIAGWMIQRFEQGAL